MGVTKRPETYPKTVWIPDSPFSSRIRFVWTVEYLDGFRLEIKLRIA